MRQQQKFFPRPPSAKVPAPPPTTLQYNNFIDRKLTIKIVCENAKLNSPYVTEKIEYVIKNAEYL
jgi:hypothetical protein